jgi:hypothetical protein
MSIYEETQFGSNSDTSLGKDLLIGSLNDKIRRLNKKLEVAVDAIDFGIRAVKDVLSPNNTIARSIDEELRKVRTIIEN